MSTFACVEFGSNVYTLIISFVIMTRVRCDFVDLLHSYPLTSGEYSSKDSASQSQGESKMQFGSAGLDLRMHWDRHCNCVLGLQKRVIIKRR